MRRAAIWVAALGGSLVLHAGAVALLLTAWTPEPVADQPPARSSMALETFSAPTTQARAQQPDAEAADEAEASGAAVNAAAVPQSRARPVAARAEVAPDVSAPATRLAAVTGQAVTAEPEAPRAETAAVAAPAAMLLPAAQPDATAARPSQPAAERVPMAEVPTPLLDAASPDVARIAPAAAEGRKVGAVATPAAPIAAAAAPATATASIVAPSVHVATAEASADVVAATRAQAESVRSDALPASVLAAALPDAPLAPPAAVSAPTLPETPSSDLAGVSPEAPLPATRATAALAWRFGDRLVTDPQALATIQAFMAPRELDSADEVRDDLASVLTGVECARVSATFLPESGTLELRGHIPDPALQAPLLEALRRQVGDGIPIRANLLHLPAPQCSALGGMADTGLPQSTDQFTNPLLIGATAQARDFSYSEGQRLQFDMTAPDYDAYVYVDYFAADGSVIHLVPNPTIPLSLHPAATTVPVGQDRPGQPGLRIIIGPPFGQEIAVAFAASRPVYDGLRPISEPAAPYLEFLKQQIAAARADDPDFKGEWVYFFITTSRASQ